MATFKEQVYFQDANGQTHMVFLPDGMIRAGGHGSYGRIFLMSGAATEMDTGFQARVRLSGESGDCHLGGNGSGGDLCLYGSSAKSTSDAGAATIHLRGDDAVLRVGGVGQHGDVWVSRADGKALIH